MGVRSLPAVRAVGPPPPGTSNSVIAPPGVTRPSFALLAGTIALIAGCFERIRNTLSDTDPG